MNYTMLEKHIRDASRQLLVTRKKRIIYIATHITHVKKRVCDEDSSETRIAKTRM
jgi:hypothetical protein